MINIEVTPKQFCFAKQTIPFVVSTDLFDADNFDAMERSFKYLFEIKTLRDDGVYRTFSTVAIPPRPDNLTGFFDASKIITSAITHDNGTHLNEECSPCPKSIVQFRVNCTERYLDENGDYITGNRVNLGYYYAIDGGVREGIDDYLIESATGTTKNALHHHHLLGDQFTIRPFEPLTVSFLTQPTIDGSILDFDHGDYGSFDNGDISDYTSINNIKIGSLSKSPSGLSGACLQGRVPSGKFLAGDLTGTLIEFENLNLENNTDYEFSIWLRYIKGGLLNISNNATFSASMTTTGSTTVTSITTPTVVSAQTDWREVKIAFTTDGAVYGGEKIEIKINSINFGDLQRANNRLILFDSATLKKNSTFVNNLNKARVVVNQGKPSEKIHELEPAYLTNVIGFNEISKARFDCPIGNNFFYSPLMQDTTTYQWLDDNDNIGTYYHLELFDENNDTITIAKSERIYQRGAGGSNCNTSPKYNTVRLKWLNDFGAWDYYTFDKVSIATATTQRDEYKIETGTIVGNQDGFSYQENDIQRGYKSLSILSQDIITINSDWIRNETGKFLKGLLNSSEVYILNPEPYIDLDQSETPYTLEYPVIVENNDFEYRNNSKDARLVNATFTIRIALPFNSSTTNI